MKKYSILFGLILLVWACQKDENKLNNKDEYFLKVPIGFPDPNIPDDNKLTRSRIALGKQIFYDPILSKDSSRSCGSCHNQYLAFADSSDVSFGIEQRAGTRNSPSIANVAYQKALLREGGVPTLEMQVLVPIQDHNEFNYNMLLIVDRMKRIPAYVEAAQKAYNREIDPFVITRSIAAFERTLLSGNSPFDQWFYQKKNNAVGETVIRGYSLFTSDRLNCIKCHNGFLFTDQSFTNNGLYVDYPDSGRIRLTGFDVDRAVFKVPSLRNVGLTAPYMHDGSLKSLDAVIDHYQTGGKAHPNKSIFLKSFMLSAQERLELLAFLNSLTDLEFIKNPEFK
jgi:cytochrome c peroxidase